MPDESKKIHEFALKSALFKGHTDWYICYLKSEKLAEAMLALARQNGGLAEKRTHSLDELANVATHLPHTILHFVAGEVALEILLADLFSILSSIRFCAAGGDLARENAIILEKEYQNMTERLVTGAHLSPFLSQADLFVQEMQAPAPVSLLSERSGIKDNLKDIKDILKDTKGHNSGRGLVILELVRKGGGISIKNIAKAVRDCSEKTIQRELLALIAKGLIKKEGERRWSIYLPG